ncbi:MAG: acetate--CoA ligase [Candidatus Aenigmarchaeota archaeon]|nr:acetate--CoA ligase [Candidatus Aenigmarchaeota archaeon]
MEIIKKTKKLLKEKPNMLDYEKTRRAFSWKKAEKELGWFSPGHINAAYNAVDKHIKTWRKNKVALYWEGDDKRKEYSFLDLYTLSNKFANVLKKLGIKKGDRVFLFLPRVPQLYIAFLGILKTGAIAGTMFSAFGPAGIQDRLGDSEAVAVVTTKELKKRIYKVKKDLPKLKYIIVVDEETKKRGEVNYKKEMMTADENFKICKTKATDHAFMLYTSGTTGKPKGVMHIHRAIVQEHMTMKLVLDIKDKDVYWCTADPGWVTGVAYGILGSWSNGASTVVYSGRFNPEKWYSIIEKYHVTVWYTAPTAVRMLMASNGKLVKKYDLSSLRHIASVGEPLNPEPIRWSLKTFGIPFHDNWWQTEAGGIMIANYPCMDIRLGSMGKPVPGVEAAIIDEKGRKLSAGKEGILAIKPGWPSMMQTIWKNKKKYNSYFLGKWYISGDRAYKDKDGYFWFVARDDDVIKTSGERVGPFEVESALVEHPAVVEAGVIGKPDPIRGEIIKAFVKLKKGVRPSERLKKELSNFVKKHLAGHAYPREIEFVDKLPKTRSGKIVRRVLKAKELGEKIGDTSSLMEY